MIRIVALLCFWNAAHLNAQTDSVSLDQRIEIWIQRGLPETRDSLRSVLATGEAYLESMSQKRPQWHTPLAERNQLFLNRGKANLFMGMLRLMLFPDVARMESGVLPVAAQLIVSFDSAYYYLRKAAPYVETEMQPAVLVDMQFSQMTRDSLNGMIRQIQLSNSFQASQSFKVFQMLRNIGKSLQEEHKSLPAGSHAVRFIHSATFRTDRSVERVLFQPPSGSPTSKPVQPRQQ